MITRDEAIARCKAVQSGEGVDREAVLQVLFSSQMSRLYWNDATFTYGIEWGYLIALVEAFGLTREDFEP